jgi:hypothetical protein
LRGFKPCTHNFLIKDHVHHDDAETGIFIPILKKKLSKHGEFKVVMDESWSKGGAQFVPHPCATHQSI